MAESTNGASTVAATAGRGGRGAGAESGRARRRGPRPATSARAPRRAPSAAASAPRTPRRRSAAAEPDALELLVADHRRVERLFSAFERTRRGDAMRRRALVEEIGEALAVHAGIEETVLYPAARRALREDDEVLEALEEHHVVKTLLAELERQSAESERFGAKVHVLIESVRHHVEEEEGELFPSLRRALDRARLEELGTALEAARGIAPRMAHPHAPDEPPGNLIATALTLPLDLVGMAVRRVVRLVVP